jgi:hypothetical protein
MVAGKTFVANAYRLSKTELKACRMEPPYKQEVSGKLIVGNGAFQALGKSLTNNI